MVNFPYMKEVLCPNCHGEGQFLVKTRRPPWKIWEDCGECGGKGHSLEEFDIEEKVERIEEFLREKFGE